MATRITDTDITSDQTRHVARAVEGGWAVTWLPRRVLDRNQAITAMTIAENVDAAFDTGLDERVWPHIEGWAAELGLSDVDAVAMASLSPEHYAGHPEALRFSDEVLGERVDALEDAVLAGRILERLDAIEAKLDKLLAR